MNTLRTWLRWLFEPPERVDLRTRKLTAEELDELATWAIK